MPVQLQSAEDIADVLATVITGVAGGDKASWLKLIGPIERLPTWKYVRFNWHIDPSGSDAQREVICRALEVMRSAHPYIA